MTFTGRRSLRFMRARRSRFPLCHHLHQTPDLDAQQQFIVLCDKA